MYQYIDYEISDMDESKEENHTIVNVTDHTWNVTNLDSKVIESPFYYDVQNEFEFKVQLDFTKDGDEGDKIYIILKSMPSDLQQLSMKCNIKIEEVNTNISGIVHLKQKKLKGVLVDVVFDLEAVKTMTLITNIDVIAKYQ